MEPVWNRLQASGIESRHFAGAILTGDVTTFDPDLTPQPECYQALKQRLLQSDAGEPLAVPETVDLASLAERLACASLVLDWADENFGEDEEDKA